MKLSRLGAVLALVLSFLGCAQSEDAESTVGVTLKEWSVAPDKTSAPAGDVTFDVSNEGEDDHEFMVVRTDLDFASLPTKKDGSVDEEDEDVEVIDATNAPAHGGGEEHETVEPGSAKEFSYELDAGTYVLLCNLVEEESEEGEKKTEVHYELGMRIPFSVE